MESFAKALSTLRGEIFVAYWELAASALYVYDYLLTLPRELVLVWGAGDPRGGRLKSGRWAKILYVVLRYLPFFDIVVVSRMHFYDPSPGWCGILVQMQGWADIVGYATAEMVLILRTWALYNHSRRMTLFLMITYPLFVGSACVFVALYLRTVKYTSTPTRTYHGCWNAYQSPIIFGDYLVLVVLETLLFILAAKKGWQHFRDSGSTASSGHTGRKSLVQVLYRDGVGWYLYCLVSSTTNVVVIILVSGSYAPFLVTMQRFLHSTFASRMLLNLREVSKAGSEVPVEMEMEVSGIEFGSRSLRGREADGCVGGVQEGERAGIGVEDAKEEGKGKAKAVNRASWPTSKKKRFSFRRHIESAPGAGSTAEGFGSASGSGSGTGTATANESVY